MRKRISAAWIVCLLACIPACQRKQAGASEWRPSAATLEAVTKALHNVVLRPVFETSEGEVSAGTAFLVGWEDGQRLLLTAHHLFGPMGGMTRDITARELPGVVKGVSARSADDDAVRVESRTLLSIAAAQRFGQDDMSRDLAAFIVDDPGKAGVLPVAPGPPRNGDLVFLLAELNGRRERLFPGKVVSVTPKLLAFAIDDSEVQLQGASGAPVLNERGKLVGICIASGPAMGELHVYANPINAMRTEIARALRAQQL